MVKNTKFKLAIYSLIAEIGYWFKWFTIGIILLNIVKAINSQFNLVHYLALIGLAIASHNLSKEAKNEYARLTENVSGS